MMKISVPRRKYEIPNKQEMLELTNWFVKKYITNQACIDIEVRMNKRLRILGECEKVSDHCYNVFINPYQSENSIVKTLVHELIHVKQYYLGEMKDSTTMFDGEEVPDSMIVIWKGERIDLRKVPYMFLPWELEAYQQDGKIHGIWKRTREGKKFQKSKKNT